MATKPQGNINAINGGNESPGGTTEKTDTNLYLARVTDVIHDYSSDFWNTPLDQGKIKFIFEGKKTKRTQNIRGGTASPLFPFLKGLPIKNELVIVLNKINPAGGDSFFYISSLNLNNQPSYNPDASENDIKENGDIDLGKGLNESILSKIRKLLLLPGDVILEGTFGNSIRLGNSNIFQQGKVDIKSPYEGEENSPIIVIRNGQAETQNKYSVFEDINNDNSSFYLTKGQKLPINVSSGNLETFGGELKDIVQNATPIEDSNEDYSTPIFNNDQIV